MPLNVTTQGGSMKTVFISKNPPRDLAQFADIDMWYNLKGNFYSAGILGGIGLIVLAWLFAGPYESGIITFKAIVSLVLCGIAGRLIYRTIQVHRLRVQAFSAGTLQKGEIVSHGGTFVIWRVNRSYTLIVQVRTEEGKVLEKKILSQNPSMHAEYPLHDDMEVLVDAATGAMFLPPEVDIKAAFV